MNADGTAPLHVATDPVILQVPRSSNCCFVLYLYYNLQSLLDHEADINACDHAGNMPLHVACGRQSVTDHMLDIRLLVRSHYSNTPTHLTNLTLVNNEDIGLSGANCNRRSSIMLCWMLPTTR